MWIKSIYMQEHSSDKVESSLKSCDMIQTYNVKKSRAYLSVSASVMLVIHMQWLTHVRLCVGMIYTHAHFGMDLSTSLCFAECALASVLTWSTAWTSVNNSSWPRNLTVSGPWFLKKLNITQSNREANF